MKTYIVSFLTFNDGEICNNVLYKTKAESKEEAIEIVKANLLEELNGASDCFIKANCLEDIYDGMIDFEIYADVLEDIEVVENKSKN